MKAVREKGQGTYKGRPIRITSDFSTETMKARRSLRYILAGFGCQLDTGWSYHRERTFSWKDASMRSSCKAFSQLVIKGERPPLDGAIAGLVVMENRLSKPGEASQ